MYPSHAMDWKKLLPVIGIILLVYILWRFHLEKILSVFATINPLYAALCFLAWPVVLLIINVQWQMILKRQCIHVSYLYSLKNLLIGYFYGFITPGGFGNYLRALYLKQESNAPLPKCVSNLVTYNMVDYLTLFTMGTIGSTLLIGQIPLLFAVMIVLLMIVFLLFAYFFRQHTLKRLFDRLLRTRIFRFIERFLGDSLESFYEDLPSFRSLLLPILVSFLSWIVFFTELSLIAPLFDIHLPYLTLMFMFAIASTIATIPVSIFGLGTRDATLVAVLALYNVPPENSISFTLFWFMIFWVTPSIIGAVITLVESKNLPRKGSEFKALGEKR